ncbi:hypothetical protein ABW20_dc0101363 [Dactylellina cionopaga]|nr:hypothetical protein ABW20_dc0101363 [Dactylellina cionopaga]
MAKPGGFIPPGTYLPSPAPSNYSSTAARSSGLLPNQRSAPLKSGSKRESAFINYVDNALLEISRKFTKKFPTEEENYLLQIASSLLQYLPPFPPRPTPTFRLFNKLDLAFHTLLSDYKMSGTEKVRLNSTVKLSRAMVIRLMEGQDFPIEENDGKNRPSGQEVTDDEGEDPDSDLDLDIKSEDDSEDDMEIDESSEGEASRLQRKYGRPTKKELDRTERIVEEEKEDEEWEIEVARVYSRVLEDIGGDLGGETIGIVVDE